MLRTFLAALIGTCICTAAAAQPSPFSVEGLTIGERVLVGSIGYREYACRPSDQFAGFTWCTKKVGGRERRGPFLATYSLMHSADGVIAYVNRHQEPVYWSATEVNDDIQRHARRLGSQPYVIHMPPRPGFSNGTLAAWGNVVLRPVDNASRALLAADRSPGVGILVDFIGDIHVSAKAALPVYRIAGGAGFVWAASHGNGRGTLRYFAVDTTAYSPRLPDAAAAPTAPAEQAQ